MVFRGLLGRAVSFAVGLGGLGIGFFCTEFFFFESCYVFDEEGGCDV